MLDISFFKGKKIFITGHTGFKGSWLAFILKNFGADVTGYALKPKNSFDNFYLLKLDKSIKNYYNDIRDYSKLKKSLQESKPDIIFHLAAQSLVKKSFIDPYLTFSTNIFGTINILEEIKTLKSIKSVIIVTSDKCYKNKEKLNGYSENSELGGIDPYSASKAASENVFYSYLNSFYNKPKFNFGLASVRAGNVIGGGDWSNDRIIPDFIKSIWHNNKFIIRRPKSTRPWQHVFDLLNGYMILSHKIFKNKKNNGSWNFGPNKKNITVLDIINEIKKKINSKKKIIIKKDSSIKETGLLSLKSQKANKFLNWKPKLTMNKSLELTANWYKIFLNDKKSVLNLSKKQVEYFFYDRRR